MYNEALTRVEHMSNLDASRLNKEVTNKVETILDLQRREAGDPVFYADSMFLAPLEPKYASPRLDYYDRGEGSDGYGRAAWMRLTEWRPLFGPRGGVAGLIFVWVWWERLGWNVKVVLEGLERVAAEGGWGEEVDADPERPWR